MNIKEHELISFYIGLIYGIFVPCISEFSMYIIDDGHFEIEISILRTYIFTLYMTHMYYSITYIYRKWFAIDEKRTFFTWKVSPNVVTVIYIINPVIISCLTEITLFMLRKKTDHFWRNMLFAGPSSMLVTIWIEMSGLNTIIRKNLLNNLPP